MRKKHFLQLAVCMSRVLDRMAEWSEPGTAGRVIGLDIAEEVMLDGLAQFVADNYGDAPMFRQAVESIGKGERIQVEPIGR